MINDNSKLAAYAAILRKKYSLNNKLLLVQAPQLMFDSFNLQVAKQKGYYAYPPTGLQCIAKALSARNLEIDILDLNFQLLKRVIDDDSFDYLDWLNILDEYLQKIRPSIIGVSCISIYTDVFRDAHPLTSLLKHLRKKDESIIIAGGTIATNEYENYLKKDLCHFVVEGEGENKINFLFDYLLGERHKHSSTPGIYFKFEENIEQTKGKKDTVVLKGNLIDTYKYVPIEDYKDVGSLNPFSRMAGQNRRFTGIQLNRGCRANCKFCAVVEFMGKGLRQYPVEDLLEEIHYHVQMRGIRYFEVLDDDFFGYQSSNKAVITLLQELAKLNKIYGISWAAGNGFIAASLNEQLLNLMRDSGCVGFRVGIESGNAEMLKRMRKPASLPLLQKIGTTLQKFPQIFVAGNYIIGLFGEETFGEMMDTFSFSCEMNLDWSAFTTFQFTSKATALAENLKSKGRIATDFVPAKDNPNREVIESEEIVCGPEVFNLAEDLIPSREQTKQIWFTFNLVANYINNKNLKTGGRPEKFISWVKAVQVVYPENPYMSLFTGIAYLLLGRHRLTRQSLEQTKENLQSSRYWQGRFTQFGLHDVIINFPQDAQQAKTLLMTLRRRYSQWTGEDEIKEEVATCENIMP